MDVYQKGIDSVLSNIKEGDCELAYALEINLLYQFVCDTRDRKYDPETLAQIADHLLKSIPDKYPSPVGYH